MKSILTATICTIFLAGSLTAAAPIPPGQSSSSRADNTKVNKQDRSEGKLMADQQGQSASDRDTSRQIRKSILQDKSLSTYAHNVKIITKDGLVTLRGPVRSTKEKLAVEARAKEIAGEDKVTDDLKVAGKKKS